MTLSDDRPMSAEWNYHPSLPLADPSIFRWPPDPGSVPRWFIKNWLTFSERVMMVAVAVALWAFAYPPLEAARDFAFGWVFQVWAVNMAVMIAVAEGGASLVLLHAQGSG